MPPAAEPFWLCHECHAEMHPLMVDGIPHCASCSSDFLEILDEAINPPSPPLSPHGHFHHPGAHFGIEIFDENEADVDNDRVHGSHTQHQPPSDQTHQQHNNHAAPGGILSGMLSGLLGAAVGGNAGGSAQRTNSGTGVRTMTFDFGGGTGTILIGRPGSSLPGRGMTDQGEMGLEEFFDGFGAGSGPVPRRRSEYGDARGQQAHTPMSANDMVEAMLGMLLDGRPPEGLGGLGAGSFGNLGDYVLSQEGFDNVMEHLMHAAGPQGPIPASQVVIDGLPRIRLTRESLDASDYKDCPVCKDDFEPGDEVMRIPCTHIFHVDCLKPWLERNGSCPVCRFSLVPEGAQRPSNPNPNPNPMNNVGESNAPTSGPAEQGVTGLGGLLSSLFSATFGARQPATASQVTDATRRSGANEATSAAAANAPSASPAHDVPMGEQRPPDAPGAWPTEDPSSGIREAQQAPPPATPTDSSAPSATTHSGEPQAISATYPSAIPQEYRERHARRQAEEQAEEERLLRDLD